MNKTLISTIGLFLVAHWSFADDFQIQKRRVPDSLPRIQTETWQTQKTAVIVCDMWDAHHCLNAVKRVKEMAPRMNRLLEQMRNGGATIIHAPSSCVNFYENHPARINVSKIPRSKNIPEGIGQWCDHIPSEKHYPLDQSDGGEDDKPGEHQEWAETLKSKGRNPRAPWKRQIGTLEISDQDFITDNGEAVWSILDHKNIDDVLMVGVHTNMCVLGRPFGLRQLSKNGKNVVLVRDLTDTMYNPDRWPFVDHYQGNRLIHQHIERFVCGTITSDQILGGKEFRFKNDKPRKCVVICAESIYSTEITLKTFSENVLQRQLGFQTTLLTAAKGEHEIPGLEKAVGSADLVILSIRRRSLPAKQLETVRRHLELGKPIVAIRTSSHAFDTKGNHPEGHAEWQDFDSKVLGCDYTGHYPNQVSSAITVGKDHAILTNVKITQSAGSLYKSKPLGPHCTVLLYGKIENHDAEPIAWTNQYRDSRIFYTSLGHKTDFENPGFTTLLENGIRWATEMKIGTEPSRKK